MPATVTTTPSHLRDEIGSCSSVAENSATKMGAV